MSERPWIDLAQAAITSCVKDTVLVTRPDGSQFHQMLLKNDSLNIVLSAVDKIIDGDGGPVDHEAVDILAMTASNWFPAAKKLIFEKFWFSLCQKQVDTGAWQHKGLPLVRLWDYFHEVGNDYQSRRFGLLTLIEDAYRDRYKPGFSAENSGAYSRAQMLFGMQESELQKLFELVKAIYPEPEHSPELATEDYGALPAGHPHFWTELVLESLLRNDNSLQSFMNSGSCQSSSNAVLLNPALIEALKNQLVDHPSIAASGTTKRAGDSLEALASVIFSGVSGVRSLRNWQGAFQIDVLVDVVGNSGLYSRFGPTIVVECKSWEANADVTVAAKLVASLKLANSKTGILLLKNGITGDQNYQHAHRIILSSFQKLDATILVISLNEIESIQTEGGLMHLLAKKWTELQMMERDNNPLPS